MSSDDVLKATLASVASCLFYKAYKPPHAPMPARERDSKVEASMENRFWTHYMVIMKATTQLLIGLAEISLLVFRNFRWHPLYPVMRSLFIFQGGNVDNLQLTWAHILGAALMILGGAIRISAISALGKFFRFQVGIQKDHRLITYGLYSVVRHPAYMGMQMTHIGSLLFNLAPGSWVRESGLSNSVLGAMFVVAYFGFIVSTFYTITIVRMRKEDKVIQQTFGKEWEDWAKRVPYRVVPGVY